MSERCAKSNNCPSKPGCWKDKTLDELAAPIPGTSMRAGMYLWCNGLTDTQRSLIAFLQKNGHGDLRVSAPSYYFPSPVSWPVPICHHYGSNCIDFTANENETLWKAWEFLRRTWPGRTVLGLNSSKYGYTAQRHLHVDGSWTLKEYRHGFETKGSGDYGWILNGSPAYATVLARAKEIYGIKGTYIHPDTVDYTDAKKCTSAGSYALLGGLIGAALGYEPDNYTRTGLYAGGGAAAGYVLGQILCRF